MSETKKPEWVPTEYHLSTDAGVGASVNGPEEFGRWRWQARYADNYAAGMSKTEADAKRFAEEALAFLQERAQ